MLINASKREEEDGLRRENGGEGYATRGGLPGTRNEFIKGKERRAFPRFSPRRSEILWKFFFSPCLSDTGSSVRARVALVQFLCDSVGCEMSLLIHII